MPRGRTATPPVWPPDQLREAAELLRHPYRCNNNPQQDRATADLLDFIAGRWCADAKHYPGRQQLQDMAVSIAAAVCSVREFVPVPAEIGTGDGDG